MRPHAGAAGSMASMEWEPKALSLHELKYAREAALYVLRTHSSEDAVRIFTEGLKPVLGVRKDSMTDSDEEDDQGDEDYDMFNPYAFLDDDSICCHRQYGRTAAERDVATAPF
ncbi:hypothetical protein D1007_12089 [Hordeum vulgare]|uniref:Predicted protein n=1 Tax=Hordeum vulgare subsp. vulgare TaxID=112509 RepID=F2EAA6_HORVV|nr:uncharacterized protein LOC123451212 [Hordeum vulgare subsp. vulgare]KAE8811094.1 hypothetical protein D1007_12089 [Hordeum vulgare]KAI4997640.1 hypothetical protein ZWY2020_052982 [Hordeum vulgare]BAK04278.1 predicted protein [Hordeum vulgare subsp. vulgare]